MTRCLDCLRPVVFRVRQRKRKGNPLTLRKGNKDGHDLCPRCYRDLLNSTREVTT